MTEYKRFLKSAVPIVIAKLTCPDVSTDKVREYLPECIKAWGYNRLFTLWIDEQCEFYSSYSCTLWISNTFWFSLFLSLSLSLSSYILSSVCICMSVSLNSVLRMKKLKWQRWHRQQQYFPLDNNLSTWITRRYEMLYIFAFSLRAWWNTSRYRCLLCLQQNLQQEKNDFI